jgi:hypothetical protein
MKKLLLGALVILSSCSNGEYKDVKDITDITLVAEKDSVKLYLANHNGIYIYFTNKGGVAVR